MITNDLLKRKILAHLITDKNYPVTTLLELIDKNNIGDGDWILSDDMCEYSNNKLIQLGSIGMGCYIEKPFKYIDNDTYDRIKCSEICCGDLLLNRFISNNQLSGCIVPKIDGRLLTSVDVCWIKENPDKYLNKYLMYCFLSEDVQRKILLKSSGTTRIRISKNNLIRIPIPLPSIEEQTRVVEKIDEVFELIDRKEKNDQDKVKLKEVLKEKIIDSAIHGLLVENDSSLKPIDIPEIKNNVPFVIPSNWRWSTLNNIFDVKGGKRIPKGESFSDNGTQVYIRVADMNNMTISLSNLKYIDERVRNMIKNYIISSNDLYITVAGTIGQVGSVPKELDGMNLTENANRLIPKNVDKEFYKYILNGKYMQNEIRNNTTKAAQPKLAIKRINDLVIPVPPLEEQKRIVEIIEKAYELIEQL